MKKLKNLQIFKLIGYALLGLYIVAVIGMLYVVSGLDMLPAKFLLIIGIVMAILGAVLAIMHEKLLCHSQCAFRGDDCFKRIGNLIYPQDR